MCASLNSKVYVRWALEVSVGPDHMALRTGNGFSWSNDFPGLTFEVYALGFHQKATSEAM